MFISQTLKPSLYAAPVAGSDRLPHLFGGRCRCGHAFFPMQAYGCERCGAVGDDLQIVEMPARGTLVASSRVLMHARKDREVPFVVVTVALDDGPVVRTLLDEDANDPLPIGMSLQGCLVQVGRTESGEPIVDLRFSRAA